MRHGSKWLGICIGTLGLALALAPVSAASAKSHSTAVVKGSNPKSAMCKDVKTEQTGSSGLGQSIERAVASGNFARAKQAMLTAYNADLSNVQKALGVIKTAPPKVQSAFKNLLTFVQQIKSDIQSASSLQGLITSFASLGKNPHLVTDGTTIANWYASVCGGPLVTTTSVTSGNIP